MNAVRRGHREVFSELLSYPHDLTITDCDGSTIFHHVALGQNEEWLEEIRDKQNINSEDLKHLIDKKDSNGGWTALHYAARFNNHKMIKWLFLNGANVNIRRNDGKLPNEHSMCDRRTERIFSEHQPSVD